jgi:hypothetical protein
VERCHGLCDQFFWSRHQFATVQEVQEHYPDFLQQLRHDYEVPDQPGVTPTQLRQQLEDQRVRSLKPSWAWSEGLTLPLVEGTVHCIRATDTQARLSAFGRSFTLDAEHRRSYIRASLAVAEQRLRFYFQEAPEEDPQLIDTRPFELPERVQSYDPTLAEKMLL